MNLKEIRKSRGYTQTELANKMGVTQATFSYWEKENRTPDIHTAVKLADILGVSVDYLLGVDQAAGSNDLIDYPVIGTIKAGYDGEAVEEYTGESIPIPKQFLQGYKHDDFMVLRISGTSMYPKFLDGDYVLIHRQPSVDSGAIACILYGTEATVKTVRYIKGEDWLELIPTNPEYPTKLIEGADLQTCRVLGKVVKLIRDI